MGYVSRLTSKSQVTVPKDVRRALGVGPGEDVQFEVDDEGRVLLSAASDDAAREKRRADFVRRVALVSADFCKHDPLPGMDGLTYQRMMRGDGPEV